MTSSSLRYRESKEQSGEILRQVLAVMGQHDAAFNPVNFAVWYEHLAGINGRLTQALLKAQQTEPRLSDTTLAQLHQEYVAEPDAQSMQQVSRQLQRVMTGVSGSASRTGERAVAYEGQLNELVSEIKSDAPFAAQSLISRILDETTQMGQSARELSSEVTICRLEINRLSNELTRALDEALIDPLTGILNRKGFDQSLAAMLEVAPKKGASHCMILFDIDLFKKVNDLYGHVMGDRVIQAVGETLKACAAHLKSHSVARYGGEEFVILLPDCTLEMANQVAETVRQRTKSIKIRDRRSNSVAVSITISGGVAALRPGDQAKALIERADRALYQSKLAGRDRITAC